MINTRLRYDEEGKFPVTNDFRQIAIIKDPIDFSNQTVKTNTAFSQLTTLTLSGVGDDNYLEDEIVYQGSSLANASFIGTVVEWNGSNQVRLSDVRGTVQAETLIGTTSGATGAVIVPFTIAELQPHSGQLLYIDNIKPIIRASDQIEDFKIVLKF
jgi:hypothetical protein